MLNLIRASAEDARILTDISTESFGHDARTYLGKTLGPYGYNSLEWHLQKIDECDYYKIVNDNEIIGGLYISQISGSHYRLECIFIHPNKQNQKLGTQLIQLMEQSYPSARKWTLDTPSWNPRTNHFYPKLGYVKTGEEDLKFLVLNLYEKNI